MNTANYQTANNKGFPFFSIFSLLVALFIFFLAIMLLNSCNMPKYCAEHFPPTIERHDSIAYIEVEKLRDTTIYIPGESYIIFDSIPCDENNLAQLHEKKVKTNRGQLSIQVKDGKLTAKCNYDSLQAVISAKDRTISKLEESSKTDVLTKYVKTKFDRFCNIFFYIVCALLVGFIAAKIFKLKIPFV